MTEQEPLKAFPKTGVCWEANPALLDYLKRRKDNISGHSVTYTEIINRGLAWNDNGIWTVSTSSNRTEYLLKELVRFIEPPAHLMENPLTPEECYLPEKWYIEVTKDNYDDITLFMKNHKKDWENYSDDWTLNSYNYFHYPPFSPIMHSWHKPREGYTKVTKQQIIHVLTNKQINNTLNLEENGESSTIKVQRSDITVRDTGEIRGVGIRCPKIQIKVGSGHLPD